jgi:hypothetical protein
MLSIVNMSVVKMEEAYAPEDLEDFVNLRVAREQRLPRAHLGENAADGPHVHTRRVLPAAQQNLGRAVPQRHDLDMSAYAVHFLP